MPVKITNRSNGPVALELNSGDSVHLAPGETSPPIEDVDITDNQWVERLLDRDLIGVERSGEQKTARGRPRRAQQQSSSPDSQT
jgi:hypothetical protein